VHYKPKITFRLILITGVFLALLLSCSRIERHKVLTFFFDGVPPLDSGLSDPNSLSDEGLTRAGLNRTHHQPDKEGKCYICHGGREDRTFTSEVKLTSPIPQLCYDCHTNRTETAEIIHGPVAVEDCLFCHDPHKSSYSYLLNKPIPLLCYQCHDRKNIRGITDHSKKSYEQCNRCHEGHVSSNRALLKDEPGK
jgi:predicted CXXCH cytochrome family protein